MIYTSDFTSTEREAITVCRQHAKNFMLVLTSDSEHGLIFAFRSLKNPTKLVLSDAINTLVAMYDYNYAEVKDFLVEYSHCPYSAKLDKLIEALELF